MKAYVVTREYSGEASYEVLRVFTSKERADQDLALVAGDHGLTYRIHEVDYLQLMEEVTKEFVDGLFKP